METIKSLSAASFAGFSGGTVALSYTRGEVERKMDWRDFLLVLVCPL
jgi:hypothetical protein